MSLKKLIAVFLGCLIASPAWAGTATLNYSPSGTSPLRFTTDSSSNYLNNVTIWDYSAGANGWHIDTSNGGIVAGEGTAGTPAGGVVTVQAPSSGGTTFPVSDSTTHTDLGTINTTLGSPMQNSGGSVTANAGTNLNTSALALHSDIATNGLTTAHTCSVLDFSVLGCLGQIDDDIKGAIAAGTNIIGYTSGDACSQLTKLGAPISLTASGQVITGTSAKKTYICSIDLITATAQNIALVEGTGSTCATNIYGLAGGTTAATGWNLPANGGLTKGAGSGTVYSPSGDTNASDANVCLLLSSTGQTSGQITYVQQ